MRRFELHRDEDTSGVSGIGVVAQGVEFDDGTCVMRWLTATSSTAVYAGVADVEAIHGHAGRTRLVWLDRQDWDLSDQPTQPITCTFLQAPERAVGDNLQQLGRRQDIIARLSRPA